MIKWKYAKSYQYVKHTIDIGDTPVILKRRLQEKFFPALDSLGLSLMIVHCVILLTLTQKLSSSGNSGKSTLHQSGGREEREDWKNMEGSSSLLFIVSRRQASSIWKSKSARQCGGRPNWAWGSQSIVEFQHYFLLPMGPWALELETHSLILSTSHSVNKCLLIICVPDCGLVWTIQKIL